jgi:phosphatidylglycerophosphate synthase
MESLYTEVTDRAKGGKAPSSSKLLGGELKACWILVMRPIEDFLIEEKVHPNVLTIVSLVVSAIAGLLFHFGFIFAAGMVLIAGSTFDMLDGRVARAQGISTRHGAFFDSCLDRIGETLVLLGLFSFFRHSPFAYVVFLALAASTMVSYARARAEGLGVSCDVGIMQRTERIVYLGVASVFNYFVNLLSEVAGFPKGDYLLKISLMLILVFSSYTVWQRLRAVLLTLKKEENPPPRLDVKDTGS